MNEQNIYQRIRAIIEQDKTLTDAQKREFSEVFARTKERPLVPVLRLFEKDPRWVAILYDNYAQKKSAFMTGSMAQWRDIVAKEKERLLSAK